jgi:methyl acetate hydrolase
MTIDLDRDRLDAVLADGVGREAVAGVVATVVDRSGVRYEGAAGERARGSGVAMTVDTVGALFSMTKAITAAAAMQLVERGELDLDAPASDVCPELADRKVLTGYGADGTPVLRPAASAPTLRQLLTHTSGFGYELFNADLVRWHEITGTPGLAANGPEMLEAPLVSDPGTRWEYGIGLDWVGVMIERVSGRRLGEHVRERLLGPLGMAETTYVPTDAMLARLATIHARLPDGSLLPLPMPTPTVDTHQGGGAGLYGTAGDYARFVRMILRGGELDGERVLAEDTVRQMTTNQMGELRVVPMISAMPQLTNDAEFFPGAAKSWGLSFQINEDPAATGRPAGTLMWAGLANSCFWIDPASGVGGVYLCQVLPYADPAAEQLFLEFETAVYSDIGAKMAAEI